MSRRSPAVRRAILLAAWIAVFCAGCTSVSTTDPTAVPAHATAAPAAGSIPVDDEQAIRAAIQTLNNASAGPVDGQQSAFRDVSDPAGRGTLDGCPPATTTLRFEPVWAGLRVAQPGDSGSSGHHYALPTLIRVYTGDRITATDLTTLQLLVQSGAAYITPFCVG